MSGLTLQGGTASITIAVLTLVHAQLSLLEGVLAQDNKTPNLCGNLAAVNVPQARFGSAGRSPVSGLTAAVCTCKQSHVPLRVNLRRRRAREATLQTSLIYEQYTF
jgi:hypothetical protein